MRLVVLLLFLPIFGFSQKALFITLKPMFGTQEYQVGTNYTGNNGKVVKLNYLKYYIGDVSIVHDGGQILDLTQSVYLIGDTNYTLYLGYHNVTQIEQVNFLVGVPGRFNTQAGSMAQDISLYPETDALSFQSPSMYWGWAAGYMHMVVEGKADGNNDQNPESLFQLHNFGDHSQAPVSISSVIQTNTTANQIDVHLICHVDRWLNNINLASVGILHGEDGLNLEVMQNVTSQVVFEQSPTAGVPTDNQSSVQFSSLQGAIQCEWNGQQSETEIILFDSFGREMRKQSFGNTVGKFTWIGLTPGMYFIQYPGQNGQAQSRQVLVF